MRELRFLNNPQLRMKASGGGLEGYAAVFDQWSEDLGGFRESIKPGAFKRSVSRGADVKCLFNHDASILLGRTKSGTLRLSEDSTGLYFDCDLPQTSAANDIRESIRRGDIDQCSFGFTTRADDWTDNGTRRELLDVDLLDVSPVTYPAYPQTSVSARSLWPDGVPVKVKSHQTRESGSGLYTLGAVRSVVGQEAEIEQMRARVRACTSSELETERARARLRLVGFER